MPVDIRYIDRIPWAVTEPQEPKNRAWLRLPFSIDDSFSAHAAAVAFMTDFPMFEPALFPHGIPWAAVVSGEALFGSSLDHSVWFHQDARADNWLLLVQESSITTHSRGMCRAEVFDAAGALVASVAQEIVFVRPR
ncbi:hypothetical protein AXA44_36670 [Rhodococcus sp. SC4]|nr:hypothetical protein AXA44_36670 [Rhodococcus sp. SC4]